MPTLSDSNINIIKFHINQASHLKCSYNGSLSRDYNDNELIQIDNQIGRCEAAFTLTSLNAESLVPESQEIVDQDITLTTSTPTEYGTSTRTTTYGDRIKTLSKRPSYNQRLSAYYKEVERLGRILGIKL